MSEKGETISLKGLDDGVYVYIAVNASLHANDCTVFGLSPSETRALTSKFSTSGSEIMNGVLLKGHAIAVINALSEIGYKVISTSGETLMTWTLQRRSLKG